MNTYNLVISTPDGSAFEGKAIMLVARGTEGELAIMAGHIPFITAINAGECKVVLPDESEKIALIGGGILTVKSEKTTLLCSEINWK